MRRSQKSSEPAGAAIPAASWGGVAPRGSNWGGTPQELAGGDAGALPPRRFLASAPVPGQPASPHHCAFRGFLARCFALAVLCRAALDSVAAVDPLAELDRCNVVWESPSTKSSGSMPLGNGDLGLNVWVEENGDLLFFICKTDAWGDSGRLLKLGQVRVRLSPALATGSFRQELQLRNGVIEIPSAN